MALTRATLILLVLLLSGCGSDVDLDSLDAAKAELSEWLDDVQSNTTSTSKSSREGYRDLRSFLSSRNISDSKIRTLEDAMRKMKDNYEQLLDSFEESVDAGNELRSLLIERAKQNTNKKWRNDLLDRIDEVWEGFEEKAESAEDVIDTFGNEIQLFDDVLGYLQVQSGLTGFGSIEDDIAGIEEAASVFVAEVRSYIEQGQLLINQ